MKKILVIILSFVSLGLMAATAVPNVGSGRIRVVGNNLQNYYYNYNTGRGNYTDAERIAKTRKIVDAMLQANADIYAFCEVEAKPIVLQQLADSMNAHAGVAGRYAAVNDGINEEWDSQYNNNIKSGFIYRTDRVKPYGSNYAAATATYYKNTMRIQAWEEKSTGERFTLSMNHFKAMADGAEMRVTNATWLMNNLPSRAQDPDILILGDLNAEMDEECISVITNKGYAEQLLRFDENAYSYIYSSKRELIDHAFANSTMANQITGAAVWHVNTSAYSSDRYSDHDAYLVAINLGDQQPGGDECQPIDFSESFATSLGAFEAVDVSGSSHWFWKSDYTCAYVNAYLTYPDEDWLVSPIFDLSDQKSGTISFSHALGYGTQSEWPDVCQLYIADDYSGDVSMASWTQLTIPNWGSSNWAWVNNSITIPSEYMGQNSVRFAFRYYAQTSAPAWEIKNLTVQTTCESGTTTTITNTQVNEPYRKVIRDGQLIIERDGIYYTITGQRIK